MILTDSDIVTLADMVAVDPEVPTVAQALSISVEGPGSILEANARQITTELASRYQTYSGYMMGIGISANHNAAVQNVYSTAISRPRMRASQVVAKEPDPSARAFFDWMLYSGLYSFYRAAAHRMQIDRYQLKLTMFDQERKCAQDQLFAVGVPVIVSPLACPAATREFRSGTWSSSNLTNHPVSGAGTPYDIAITWTGASYQSPTNAGNAESSPSARATISSESGATVTIDISSLSPPNGMPAVGTAQGVFTPLKATGWNVYCGLSGDPPPLYLQNVSGPIPVDTKSYVLNIPPLLSGWQAGLGQFPEANFSFISVRHRA